MATARSPGELSEMVERRAAGLPLEQVLGWAEFCGLRIAVDPWVFVPRRRTEFLVQEAVALLARGGDPAGLAARGGPAGLAACGGPAGLPPPARPPPPAPPPPPPPS